MTINTAIKETPIMVYGTDRILTCHIHEAITGIELYNIIS